MKTSAQRYTGQIFTEAITLLVVATAERCYSCSICESLAAILCLPTASDLPPVIFGFLYLAEQSGFTWVSRLHLRALCHHNERRKYSSLPKHPKLCIVSKRKKEKTYFIRPVLKSPNFFKMLGFFIEHMKRGYIFPTAAYICDHCLSQMESEKKISCTVFNLIQKL